MVLKAPGLQHAQGTTLVKKGHAMPLEEMCTAIRVPGTADADAEITAHPDRACSEHKNATRDAPFRE